MHKSKVHKRGTHLTSEVHLELSGRVVDIQEASRLSAIWVLSARQTHVEVLGRVGAALGHGDHRLGHRDILALG